MSESIKHLKRVVLAMGDLQKAVEAEKPEVGELRDMLVRICQHILSELGAGGDGDGDGYTYPAPEKPVKTTITANDVERQKSFTGSAAGYYFGSRAKRERDPMGPNAAKFFGH